MDSSDHAFVEVSGGSAIEHLAGLGLVPSQLQEPLALAAAQAMELDDDHPLGSMGQLMYMWVVAGVRHQTRSNGWYAERERNMEWTVSPNGLWRINVMAGDEATGIPDVMPHSRYPRGGEGLRQARQDIVQPQLVIPELRGAMPAQVVGPVNYALLHFFDKAKGVVRAELSIPSGHDQSRRITEWYKRILLPDTDITGGGSITAVPVPTPTPAIHVRRRKS